MFAVLSVPWFSRQCFPIVNSHLAMLSHSALRIPIVHSHSELRWHGHMFLGLWLVGVARARALPLLSPACPCHPFHAFSTLPPWFFHLCSPPCPMLLSFLAMLLLALCYSLCFLFAHSVIVSLSLGQEVINHTLPALVPNLRVSSLFLVLSIQSYPDPIMIVPFSSS